MRPRSLLLSLAAVLTVVAQELPGCARTCLAPAVKESKCLPTDQPCLCTDHVLVKNVTACIMVKCTIKEALLAKNVTATACGEPVRDKSPGFVAVSDAFGILSSLCVIQRFAFKYWTKLDFGLDDWATLAAMVISIPSIAINALVVGPNGMGRDTWTLTYENITTFSRFFFILEILYFADVAMIKMALIFFYVRIFPAREVRRLLRGTLAFVALFGLVFTAIAIFQCVPINYYWWRWDGEHSGRCLDMNAITWSNAAVSIAVDAWMLAIPLWQLKSLKLDWKKKVGVAMMFCVGTFVTVVSILRLRALDFSSHSANPTWDLFDVGIWSTVEINVGIICVCMPSLRLLLVRLFPSLSTSSSQRGYIRSDPPSRRRVVDNKIVQQMTYSVEYGDKEDADDRTHVVYLRDVDVRTLPARGGENVI
ncbi:hypothetical protein L249_5188 [Ophiocordyceps polyrhachis-furcata BCC 54312]|uniref:CFEM domain-containing protein n=1 Tax=Ophiocordyceps polyrhachis-furcata BCC 54312 TaxID=1330021 RepID=A0A367L9D0_9HYPO|nr:hypothetical protein L249_5188 [Ophiocordyceps polyrhachis-furcata BCC 54312]